ncbi:hypothetical protein Golob_005841 [Gossypium lobatum]|uniref:Uncharacterized protein n=1 Tax=Gossypium lobatum TaxID=34289 RepID=A0A7J8MUE4_9ROSI|nr:hypothetical protein [Gossypium lobatum]
MIQASQKRIQSLKENNRQMMETISKLAYASFASQIQLVNRYMNTFDGKILPNVNTKNGNNIPINPLTFGNTNTNVANLFVTITELSLLIVLLLFVETLGVAGLDDDLKLKEFSNSLTKKVYTWERVLDNQDSHDEKGLVKVCIQAMFDEYMVHLEKYSYSECNSGRW